MPFDTPILAPSILAADYTKLGEQIQTCIKAGAQWIHCDIMDGHFVPNISYGPTIVDAAGRSGDAFLDVHLMIQNPGQYIESFVNAGADLLTVHLEACPHLHRIIQQIKQHDIGAGVAINPATPVQQIIPILEYVDLVLIMSVNPGFGGQSFIKSTYGKLKETAIIRQEKQLNFLIEVDGGVGPDNIQQVASAGADVFVAGSAIFKADNIPTRIQNLLHKAQKGKGTLV